MKSKKKAIAESDQDDQKYYCISHASIADGTSLNCGDLPDAKPPLCKLFCKNSSETRIMS